MANNKIVDADKSNWITKEKYRESIIKVIGNAIADCITEKEEFANKGAGDVITFDVTPREITYTQQNWNAVILWNYLHQLKADYKNSIDRSTDEVYKAIYVAVVAYYRDNYQVENLEDSVRIAISTIKAYDNALSLTEEMRKFNYYGQKTREQTFEQIWKNEGLVARITPMLSWCPVWNGEDTVDKEGKPIWHKDVDSYMLGYDYSCDLANELAQIHIKIDNIMYFINNYSFDTVRRIHYDTKKSLSMHEISKEVPLDLTKMELNSHEYLQYYVPKNQNLCKIVREYITNLFEDLGYTKIWGLD